MRHERQKYFQLAPISLEFLTRKTTGTDVHGIIPISVTTISMKLDGVTSYTRFSKYSDFLSRQSVRISALSARCN